MNNNPGLSLKAMLEVIVYYTLVISAAYLLGDNHRWISLSPHPFWVGVLYAALAYGPAEGIVAAILAALFLYVGNIPPQSPDESPTDYHLGLFMPFFLWVSVGALLGEVRARFKDKINVLKEEKEGLNKQLNLVQQQLQQMKQQSTQKQLSMEQQSHALNQVYRALCELCVLKPAQIISQLDSLVVAALKPEKFSVFACGPSGLEAAICFGWNDEDVYLRRFVPSSPVYKQVVTTMRILFRDSPLDKNILLSEGVLAGPLVDVHTDQVFGMLKIETLGDTQPSSELLEQFKLICDLVSILYSQARLLQAEDRAQIYSSKNHQEIVLSHLLYRIQSDFLTHLCRALGLPLTTLKLNIQDMVPNSNEFQLLQRLRQLQPIVHDLFPAYVQLFAGTYKGEYYLLLPAFSPEQVNELEVQIKQRFESVSSTITVQTEATVLR